MNVRTLIPAILLLLLCTLVACKGDKQTETVSFGSEKFDSTALHVALMANKDCLPVYVAQRIGLFDSLGVKVQIVGYASQIDCDTMLLNKTCDGGWADPVRRGSYGKRGATFENLFNGTEGWEVYACGKLRMKDIKALKGRTIAIARNSAESDFLNAVLKNAGVAQSDVYLPQINNLLLRAKMLTGNQVDATILTWPYTALAKQQGNVRLSTGELNGQRGSFVVKSGELSNPVQKKKWELFKQGLAMAKDSLRTRGVGAYTDVLQKDYGLPKAVADSLKFK